MRLAGVFAISAAMGRGYRPPVARARALQPAWIPGMAGKAAGRRIEDTLFTGSIGADARSSLMMNSDRGRGQPSSPPKGREIL
jgi:hypothetical protein